MPINPEYLNQLRPQFPHKTEAELELMFAASRPLRQFSGLSAHDHRRRGMERLFPSRVWHEWRDQRIASVQECLENRIQELMWIGSSNSNKSADMADVALALWWTKPEMTTIYVASPYESATETGVWAYIQEQFQEAKDHNKALPGRLKLSTNSIVHYERNPRSFITVATVDQVGKLVGKKARDFSQGLLVIILDELPAFTAAAARALMRVMPNLVSVPNLLVLGAGNFANVWDALGAFCDPNEADIPQGYAGFDPDRHFRWRTKRGGLCLRFDGLQSPNIKAGRDIYPFLTTNEYVAKIAGGPGGLQSPDAMRFVRSAPVTSLDEFTVTTGERIRAGGCFDAFEWTTDAITLFAYVDPGFGGDPCVVQKFKLGHVRIPDGTRQTVALWEEPFYVPVQVGLRDAENREQTMNRQIVASVRAHCEKHHIQPRNVAFDGSLRAGIVHAFAEWNLEVQPIDSLGSATNRPFSATETKKGEKGQPDKPVEWREKVDRLITEFWFAAASLIDSFQLRGLQLSPKAVQHLTTRRWKWQGKAKKSLETKQEYKDNLKNNGQAPESPNEGDSVVGGIEMARRLGLVLNGNAPGGGSLKLVLEMIREREMKKMIRESYSRQGLPSGTLHAMKRPKTFSSGKLHHR